MLADVAGKGIASALMASMVQGAMGAAFRTAESPDVALNALNNLVWRKTPANRYATLFSFMLGRDRPPIRGRDITRLIFIALPRELSKN